MIEITKYLSSTQGNRQAKAVDPVQKSQPTDNERRQMEDVTARKEEAKAENMEMEDLEDLSSKINEFFESSNLRLNLSIHKETDRVVSKLINQESGEVVREFPPKEILDMIVRLRKLTDNGILVDERT